METYKQVSLTFGVGVTKDGKTIYSSVRDLAMSKIKDMAAQLFGGYTLIQAQGGWVNDGMLIEEPSMMLVLFSGPIINGEDLDRLEDKINQIVAHIKIQLAQESVAVTSTEAVITYK